MEGNSRGGRANGGRTGRARAASVGVAVLLCSLLSAAAVAGGAVAAGPAGATDSPNSAAPVGDAVGASPVPAPGRSPVDGSAARNGTGAPLTPVSGGDLAVSNARLVAYVDDDPSTRGGVGTFTLRTAAPDGNGTADLLYGGGDAWSSYLTVRVDGTAYVTGTDVVGATNTDDYVSRAPTARGDSIVTEWTLPEGVVVTQTVTLDGARARFEADVENADGTAHDVRVRFLFDYQLGAADGSPVRYAGSATATETAVVTPGFDSWLTADRTTASPLSGLATTETPPTRVAFARWNPAYGSPYGYEVDPDAEFYDASRRAGDAAGLLYYDLGRLDAGESAAVRTAYGPDSTDGTAAVDLRDQATRGRTVTVASASLPEGGFLGVYGADGRLLGVSDELPAGVARNVTVGLDDPLAASGTAVVVAHRDANGADRPVGVAGTAGAPVGNPYEGDDGPVSARANMTLLPPPAETVFEDQLTDGRAVVVDSVTLSAGGFVAVRDPTRPADAPGSVIGVSEYLPPGTHEDVRVEAYRVPGGQFTRLALAADRTLAATPYRDANGNERYDFVESEGETDAPYAGARVDDTAEVRVVGGDERDDREERDDDAPSDPDLTHYQVDFAAGEPIENLSADTLYADQDRLLRWALGDTEAGVTDRGRAWASADVRSCVDAGVVRRDGGTARVAFTVADGCSNVTLSLVSYTTPEEGFSREAADRQELFDATTGTFGPGEHAVTVAVPDGEAP